MVILLMLMIIVPLIILGTLGVEYVRHRKLELPKLSNRTPLTGKIEGLVKAREKVRQDEEFMMLQDEANRTGVRQWLVVNQLSIAIDPQVKNGKSGPV